MIEIHIFSFKKMYLKMSSAKCRPFCLDLSVLTCWSLNIFQTTLHYAFPSETSFEFQSSGSAQDSGNFIANALELPQSCAKLLK